MITKSLPDVVIAILGAVVALENGDAIEISDVSGYEISYFYRAAPPLLQRGWIFRPFHGKYQMTERGKIVLAIEIGRRTKARNAGYKNKCQSFDKFEVERRVVA